MFDSSFIALVIILKRISYCVLKASGPYGAFLSFLVLFPELESFFLLELIVCKFPRLIG